MVQSYFKFKCWMSLLLLFNSVGIKTGFSLAWLLFLYLIFYIHTISCLLVFLIVFSKKKSLRNKFMVKKAVVVVRKDDDDDDEKRFFFLVFFPKKISLDSCPSFDRRVPAKFR